jgi:hypothetical protein
MSKWVKADTLRPELGSHVRVFHPEWKDEFTPTGTREASYIEGEFIMGVWNVEQDCWDVAEADPTHWTYPDSPEDYE